MISKTTKNHLIPLDYEEKRFATNNELLIDKETNDLYATDINGNLINFYEEHLSKLERDEIIKQHSIYGISVDMSNPDSEGSVTYIKRSKKFTPLTVNLDTGECDYGSWEDIITNFFGVKPCIFSDKVEVYLDPKDYSKTIDGKDASNYTGNVMIEFRRLFYKFTIEGDRLEFKVSNVNTDGTYIEDAFLMDTDKYDSIVNDFMYIAAYPSSKDEETGAIRSLPGFDPYIATGSIVDLLSEIESTESRQTIIGYSKYLYVLGLSWLVTKSTDVSILGRGSGKYTTGSLANKGLFFGTYDGPSKIFGLENFWTGMPQLCVGLMSRRSSVYLLKHGPYKNIDNIKKTEIDLDVPPDEFVIGYASRYESDSDIIFPKGLSLDINCVEHFEGICIYANDTMNRYATINQGGIQFFDTNAFLVKFVTRLTYC